MWVWSASVRLSCRGSVGTVYLAHPRARCKRNLAPRHVMRYRPYYLASYLWDNRVAQSAQAVCPMGYPRCYARRAGIFFRPLAKCSTAVQSFG